MPDGAVAIVTDSAACLPAELAAAHGVIVVPLQLLAGSLSGMDGEPGLAAAIEAAVAGGERLTTARPSPERFVTAYRQAAAAGADAVVSLHLSGQLSGTVGSADLAAAESPVPVTVVDTRQIGMGLGLAVLAAAVAAGVDRPASEVAAAARRYAGRARSFFVLDSVRMLLASGRLPGERPPPAAAGGPAVRAAPGRPAAPPLAARPILEIGAGRIALLERVRTRAAAADRLVELALGSTDELGSGAVVAVQHVAAADRAAALAIRLRTALPHIGNLYLTEASSAIRAHTGPGMLGISLGPDPAAR